MARLVTKVTKHATMPVLQYILTSNIYSVEIMLVLLVRYCALLGCESLIHVDFLSFFVFHVWQPRFPLNGIKKYLNRKQLNSVK